MIRFALKCANGHGFESWFPSSDKFDELAASGLVMCPACNSDAVAKELMAPRLRGSQKGRADDDPQLMASTGTDPKLAEAIQALKTQVEENSDYVGDKFAAEARAMHDGDLPQRSIHGEANADDAKKLIEDGVPAMPLPFIPRQKTN